MKEIIYIDVPKEWEITDEWNSHRPALYLALTKTVGSVTEFGCGFGSTPLLFKFCKRENRHFFSYESNREYSVHFPYVEIVADYNNVYFMEKTGVLFIDSAPGEQRKELIEKQANHANVIVVHDSEFGAEYVYGMSKILNTFKYRLNYTPEILPHTTVVSNFLNVNEWV